MTEKSINKKIIRRVIPLVVLIGILMYLQFIQKDSPPVESMNYQFGATNYCKINPHFVKKLKITEPVYIDMTQTRGKGLVMISSDKNAKPFQLPTWGDAGYLGPYAIDENGHIYVCPIPFVSIEKYPPSKQSVIYRVDSESGELEEFMQIPWINPPNENNPFNLLGLAYDCDTRSLYVSSVTGSTYDQEIGRILQIDVQSKKIVDQIEGIDAIGLGVFNHERAKKLYIGKARSSDIYTINLDEEGRFIDTPKELISLNELIGGGNDKCHRIRFLNNQLMELKGIEFNYTLHAESDVQRNIYNFDYDPENDQWKFREVYKQ